jgi:hypothetical protein
MPARSFAYQKAPVAPAAPLPSALANAHTVFLSNVCDGDPKTCTGIYDQLYAGLLAQGRYTLVLSPADADLIFEMHYNTRLSSVSGSSESGPISSVSSRLQLIILDRATRTALWSIAEPEARKVRAADKVLADLNALTK